LTHIYHLIGLEVATERDFGMASHRIFHWGAAAAFLSLLQVSPLLSNPAFAQGTQQQRDACTPDAFRLCTAYFPDPGRVEACLRAAGPQLSPPCYAVFFPPQQTPPQAMAPRRRSNGPQQPQPLLPPPRDDGDD
jgi:hypothetical protein